MDATITEELPLYVPDRDAAGRPCNILIGYFPAEELRRLISRGEAKPGRTGTGARTERFVTLVAGRGAVQRIRSLSSSEATRSLSTTYVEDLYPNDPADLAKKKHAKEPVIVTARLLTAMKKYRPKLGGFVRYSDGDRFPRRRFDPDLLATRPWVKDQVPRIGG